MDSVPALPLLLVERLRCSAPQFILLATASRRTLFFSRTDDICTCAVSSRLSYLFRRYSIDERAPRLSAFLWVFCW